jgi:ubiquinone/menaquinone biosynthesis C-methylase UbiE
MNTANMERVCPLEHAGSFDTWYRRLLQNPVRILSRFVREGMRVMDAGCGPGFFTIPMARLVGPYGHVIAADVQPGMLALVEKKLRGSGLERRTSLYECRAGRMTSIEPLDFLLAFYMVHETPDAAVFLQDAHAALKPGRQMLIAEPPIHVSKRAFNRMIGIAQQIGFVAVDGPPIFLAKTVVLVKR